MEDSENSVLTEANSIKSKNNGEIPKSKVNKKIIKKLKIIELISNSLNEICNENNNNEDIKNSNKLLKPFISKNIPSISIYNYLKRLLKYNKMNNSTLILMLIYIDKICEKYKLKLNFYVIHKLILASLVSAIKYNEDEHYTMDYYSKSGGISKNEMMSLEYEFLILTDFKLFVKNDLFEKYRICLEKYEEDNKEEK